MRTSLILAALLAAANPAHAEAPETAVGALRIELRDTAAIAHPGAIAAFTVDPTVAEASARDGRVTIVGVSVGSTTVSVVTDRGATTYPLLIVAPPQWRPVDAAAAVSREWSQWQGHYESSTTRLTNSLEMVDGDERRTLRAHAVNVTRLDDDELFGDDARTSMPSMSLEWRGPSHELVLLDKTVEHSPLTLDGTTVRGAHLRLRGLEIHGGVTSPLLYQNVFLATQRESVFGASYTVSDGGTSITPSVYAFPSEPQTGGSKGTMGSMLYGYTSPDHRLRLRGELGWSGILGAAGELSYYGETQRAWLTARHQPQEFAGIGIGRPVGSMVDGVWTGQPSDRLGLSLSASAARHEIGEYRQQTDTLTGEGRVKLTRRLSASAGASGGRFGGDVIGEPVHSLAAPVGLHVEGDVLGASALYRYQINSATNRGGHGGRLSMRAHKGALYASTFLDAQQDAATIELILREEPELARLLNELGLTATSPEDLARLLRENPTLSQLGYLDGATLDFHPLRTQAGLNLAWLPRDRSQQQLRLRVLYDRTRTVNDLRVTLSTAVSYSRRLTRAIDVTGTASWWARDEVMGASIDDWSFAVGARVRIDRAPSLPSWRSQTIEGLVVDETPGAGGTPVAGVKIRLDGGQVALTDSAGRFVFSDVEAREHRVEAEAPADAYFTGPSRVDVAAGDTARFAVARAPGQVVGSVRDDAGAGLAGVRLALRGVNGTRDVTTDSSGRFRVAVAAGVYRLTAAWASVPIGYDAAALDGQTIRATRGAPVEVELIAPAHRSVAGTTRAGVLVALVELGRVATVDSEGRYVFRGLPPGAYTLEATIDGNRIRRVIQLPAGPASIRGVDLL